MSKIPRTCYLVALTNLVERSMALGQENIKRYWDCLAKDSFGEGLRFHPLGGLTNGAYKVETRSGRYAFKLLNPGTSWQKIDRAAELAIMEGAAAIGVAPKCLLADANKGFVVSEFLEPVAAPQNPYDELAPVLRKLQGLSLASLPQLNPVAACQQYLGKIAAKGVEYPAVEKLVETVDFSSLEKILEPQVLCHGDLVPENILYTGEGIKLIDFEFSGMGHQVWDVAYLRSFCKGDRETQDWLSSFSVEMPAEEFERLVDLATLLSLLWSIVGAA